MRIKLLILIVIGLLIPSVSFGAIVFDAATNGGNVNPGTTLAWNHTTASSSTSTIGFVTAVGDTTDVSMGATWAGLTMTHIDKSLTPSDRYVHLWYILNPTSGTQTIIVSASSSIFIGGASASYLGAKQEAPEKSTTSTATAAGGITTSLTTITNGDWTIMGLRDNNGSPLTANAGTTLRVDSTSGYALMDSNGPKSPPGSTSLGVTLAGSNNYGTVMAAFAPVTSTPPLTKVRSIKGIGISR